MLSRARQSAMLRGRRYLDRPRPQAGRGLVPLHRRGRPLRGLLRGRDPRVPRTRRQARVVASAAVNAADAESKDAGKTFRIATYIFGWYFLNAVFGACAHALS